MHLTFYGSLFLLTLSASGNSQRPRPFLTTPSLVEVRDILSRLEAPIITTLVERFSLPVNPSLYCGKPSALETFLAAREVAASRSGRYNYGTLEYPYTLPISSPDVTSETSPFPPGRFHQDTFTGNANITAFYTQTLIPLLQPSNASFFFHLAPSGTDIRDMDAVLGMDATLLQLLSHRAHIGKIVAESKYAGNVTQYTALIKANDSNSIRTLLTNTTQESQVLLRADNAASALSTAWIAAGGIVPQVFVGGVSGAAQKVFRELIDITTQVEVEYLLQRLV